MDRLSESLSTPRVGWVKSFEPIEKLSKTSAKSSARMTFDSGFGKL